jgi:hypothetical protein
MARARQVLRLKEVESHGVSMYTYLTPLRTRTVRGTQGPKRPRTWKDKATVAHKRVWGHLGGRAGGGTARLPPRRGPRSGSGHRLYPYQLRPTRA